MLSLGFDEEGIKHALDAFGGDFTRARNLLAYQARSKQAAASKTSQPTTQPTAQVS